jgi:hypothetical protein
MAVASKEPDGMEARIARLESDMAHVRSDVAELKTDVRSLRDRMDARFDGMDAKFNGKLDGVNARIDKLVDSLASAKVWALVLYIALAGGLFGTLARSFGWL